MKKTLVLLPLLAAAVLAASCTSTPKKKRKSSSVEPTSVTSGQSGTSATKTTTVAPTTTTATKTTTVTPTSTSQEPVPTGEAQFNLTAGSHITTIDFLSNYSDYKSDFPRFEKDTGVQEFTFASLPSAGCSVWVSSYDGTGFLMMKNKDDFATTSGAAFLSNTQSLGKITSISVKAGSSASASATLNIYIGDEPVTTAGGSTAGQTITPSKTEFTTVTGSGAYFCITSSNEKYNGQLGVLTVSYTIS